jgi:hypothetical protein
MTRVDALAEARDPRLAVELVDAAVLGVADEQARRVRPEIDCCDDQMAQPRMGTKVTRVLQSPPRRGVEQSGSSPGS